MDNAEKVMRAMGEAIEKMKSIPDYKARMEQEVALMHKEREEKYPGLSSWGAVKSYDEIFKLEAMLKAEGIPFICHRLSDMRGFQICYPEDGENRVCSVILHSGSYGRGAGLLEIMGLLKPDEEQCDDVAGYLTAEDVFERIKAHHDGKWSEYYKVHEPKKTWYEKIQEMSREEIAPLLTHVYYSTLASACMPRNTYEAKKEAFLKALDEPYEEED
jgi:hypothetical protein